MNRGTGVLMKMTSLALIGAAILYLPQTLFSATGGAQPPVYGGDTAYRAVSGNQAASPMPAHARPDYRSYPQWRYRQPASSYRFRPWSGEARGRVSTAPAHHPAAPEVRSVSYWGGAPVVRDRLSRLPANAQMRMNDRIGTHDRPWMQPAPVGYNDRYRSMGYRFRPQNGPSSSHDDTRPIYRSLQVKIPSNYVFRPLNPIRHASAPAAVARQRHPMPYPAMPYPDARFRPFNPYPAQPVPMNRYAYSGYPEGAWYGAMPRPLPAPGWGLPHWRPTSPYYAQGVRSPYGFRPRPEPFPGERVPAGAYNRFARREMMPPPRYTYGVRDWRFQPYRYQARYPYPAAGQTAFRPATAPARRNRYGVDWYDGRGDSDGAWYKLPQGSWPAVTQRWPDGASTLPGDETY